MHAAPPCNLAMDSSQSSFRVIPTVCHERKLSVGDCQVGKGCMPQCKQGNASLQTSTHMLLQHMLQRCLSVVRGPANVDDQSDMPPQA